MSFLSKVWSKLFPIHSIDMSFFYPETFELHTRTEMTLEKVVFVKILNQEVYSRFKKNIHEEIGHEIVRLAVENKLFEFNAEATYGDMFSSHQVRVEGTGYFAKRKKENETLKSN